MFSSPEILSESLPRLLPELCLCGGLALTVLADLGLGRRWPWAPFVAGLLGVLSAGVALIIQGPGLETPLWGGMAADDGLAFATRLILALALALGLCVAAFDHRLAGRNAPSEYVYLVAFMAPGLFFMASATHLLLLYLATELVSTCSYVLVAFYKRERGATEAGVKYLIYGAASSAVMLYGISLLFGLAGGMDFTTPRFAEALAAQPMEAAGVALALTFGGMFFKIASAPFHFWAPDAYQAALPPVAALLSVAPKVAAFAVLVRLSAAGASVPALAEPVAYGLGAGAALSILIGSLGALVQRDFRRLLAYSGVAHSGFMLLAVAAGSRLGVAALLFYLLVYTLLNISAFWMAGMLHRAYGTSDMRRWAGLPAPPAGLGLALAVCMVGLTGLPPTAGFIAKLEVFLAVWERHEGAGSSFWLALLVLAVLGTVVSLAYYLKGPALLLLRKERQTGAADWPSQAVLALLCLLLLPVLVLGFWGFDVVLEQFLAWI